MKPKAKKLFLLLSLFIPAILAFQLVASGTVILWYDSARDLLSAWDNLSKPTLIGPTSGIPGIFYGPYWIWLLSIGIAISKDPRVVTIIAATLPYIILFPLLWFSFKKYFSTTVIISLWLLFFFGFGITYATQLWNPYPAPLLTLLLIYLLLTFRPQTMSWITALQGVSLGLVLGLVVNFHISFGLALTVGVGIFLLSDAVLDYLAIKKRKSFILTKIFFFLSVGLGLFIAFMPFILFEIRHNFQQTAVLFNALSQYGAVVSLKGMTKLEIFESFFSVLGKLLFVTAPIGGALIIATLGYFVIRVKKKKIKLVTTDKRILLLIASLLSGISLLYFTARNPVWIYHFIGVEIIFLLLIALVANKIPFIKYALLGWASLVVCFNLYTFMRDASKPMPPSLIAQKDTTETIINDAHNAGYSVIAYEPSIYQYEYTYLFRWLANKQLPYDPTQTPANANLIYLIVPTDDPEVRHQFIQYRTPDKLYDTAKSWDKPYKLEIIRRIKR